MKSGAVVLLSGGLDSTVALAETLVHQPVVCALTIDYGQRAAQQEIAATRQITKHYQIPHRLLTLPWLADLLPEALSTQAAQQNLLLSEDSADFWDVKRVWVPNRNGLFLNIAACFAEAMAVQTIVFGANAEEGVDFPDNTPAFRDRLNDLFAFSTLSGLHVETPVGDWTKSQIIEHGIQLKVPFQWIWSCYEGNEKPCQVCPSCIRVQNAQDRVGVTF